MKGLATQIVAATEVSRDAETFPITKALKICITKS